MYKDLKTAIKSKQLKYEIIQDQHISSCSTFSDLKYIQSSPLSMVHFQILKK